MLKKLGLYQGKVIGEFVCDSVENIACHKYHNGIGFYYTYYTESLDTLTNETQLTEYDMQQYLGRAEDGECVGYAWHISNLKIYDKPKELGEFTKPCDHKNDCCGCKRAIYQYRRNNSYSVSNFVGCDDKITRPPQSWQYCYDWGGMAEVKNKCVEEFLQELYNHAKQGAQDNNSDFAHACNQMKTKILAKAKECGAEIEK